MRISDWSADVCSSELAEAAAVPAGLVPPGREGRRRTGAAPRPARLRVGLPAAGHRDLPARDQLLPAERADGLARPRTVVPPSVPRRRLAAVLDRQPQRAGFARAEIGRAHV